MYVYNIHYAEEILNNYNNDISHTQSSLFNFVSRVL